MIITKIEGEKKVKKGKEEVKVVVRVGRKVVVSVKALTRAVRKDKQIKYSKKKKEKRKNGPGLLGHFLSPYDPRN